MAISIGANFSYNGKLFIDDRQGLAKTKMDLRNWNMIVPEGFEVFLEEDKEWYIFKSNNNDPDTGKFKKRNSENDSEFDRVDQEIDRLDGRIDDTNELLNSTIDDIETKHSVIYADTKNDLTIESNWIIDGKIYVKTGIIVSVINDGDNNGVYQLKSSDYKNINNWRRLLNVEDLITTLNETTESSDNNIYTAKKVDSKFIRRDIPEIITQPWEFQETIDANQINLGDNDKKIYVDEESGESIVDVDKIIAKTSEIEDLEEKIWENTNIGVSNLLINSGFNGNYESLILDPNKGLDETTVLYNEQNKGWTGYGSWEIVEDTASFSGFSVKLLTADSFLKQSINTDLLYPEESYTLSFKGKGNIVATIDGNSITCNSTEYDRYVSRFNYSGNSNIFLIFTGKGQICNIKLERGNVSTDWTRSNDDPDPVKNDLQNLEYLRSTFSNEVESIPSGLILKDVIQVKESGDPSSSIKGGISGIYTGDNAFMWTGSDINEANRVSSLLNDLANNKNDIQSSKVKLILTYDGKIFVDKIIAREAYSIKEVSSESISHQIIGLTTIPNGSEKNSSTENFIIKDLNKPLTIFANFSFNLSSGNYSSAIIDTREIILPNLYVGKDFYTPIYVKQSDLLKDDLYVKWTLLSVSDNNYKLNIELSSGDREEVYTNISNFTIGLDGKIHIIQ